MAPSLQPDAGDSGLAAPPMLAAYLPELELALQEAVGSTPSALVAAARYAMGWEDAEGRSVAAGGKRIIMQVAKTLIAHLDWGLPVDQAIAAPNIYFGGDAVLVETNTPLAKMAAELADFGTTVVQTDLGGKANAAARVGNKWQGGADPRSEGSVLTE